MPEWMNVVVFVLALLGWAVYSIMNREQAATNNSLDGRMKLGPRPGNPPQVSRRTEDGRQLAPRDPAGRPLASSSPAYRNSENDVMIISADTPPSRAATLGVNGGGISPKRKVVRSRPGSSSASKRNDAEREQAVKGGVGANLAVHLDRPLGLLPVTMPKTTLSGSGATIPTNPVVATPTGMALAAMLRSPDKLREAFMLNEIMQPPLSIRGRPGGR